MAAARTARCRRVARRTESLSWRGIELKGGYRGYVRVIWGLCRDNGKENGNYRDCRGCIGRYKGALYG